MKKILQYLQEADEFLVRANRPDFALNSIRLATNRIKKMIGKEKTAENTKVTKCSKCNSRFVQRCTCHDCKHSFTTPFDELYCSFKPFTAKRLCKRFKRTSNEIEYI